MKIKASLTIGIENSASDNVFIEVQDEASRIRIIKLEVDPVQFTKALARLSNVPCINAETGPLDRVGKKHECKDFEFPFEDKGDWKTRKERAAVESKRLCPEGWISDGYFGSQGSFFTKDGKSYARCTIRRWVDVVDQETP